MKLVEIITFQTLLLPFALNVQVAHACNGYEGVRSRLPELHSVEIKGRVYGMMFHDSVIRQEVQALHLTGRETEKYASRLESIVRRVEAILQIRFEHQLTSVSITELHRLIRQPLENPEILKIVEGDFSFLEKEIPSHLELVSLIQKKERSDREFASRLKEAVGVFQQQRKRLNMGTESGAEEMRVSGLIGMFFLTRLQYFVRALDINPLRYTLDELSQITSWTLNWSSPLQEEIEGRRALVQEKSNYLEEIELDEPVRNALESVSIYSSPN